uniref:TIR domain-containing protein n=1 Tax=Octactis speculum TaxID=3111310 RepID=A0A7S2FV16_9STRA|mmetsp:Transcript_31221/g.42293  ORF Transcript_31221/g.42293 Transcript_31221/m.42293 type:complete len:199 (+) Transcript_31221:92-688(+)
MKWDHLARCAEAFKKRRGRYPTLWIDMFCLGNGQQATDRLKGLCMYIRACDRMLVLCGPTYSTRLWCAWEIFSVLAFQTESEALKRIELVALDKVGIPEGGWESNALMALEVFSVTKSTCNDPNDEFVMKNIIDAVDRSQFDSKVQRLARSIRQGGGHMFIEPDDGMVDARGSPCTRDKLKHMTVRYNGCLIPVTARS